MGKRHEKGCHDLRFILTFTIFSNVLPTTKRWDVGAMRLEELLAWLPFTKCSVDIKEKEVRALAIDHRLVRPGDVFLCIKGHTVDGHDFAGKAAENGAMLIIAEKTVDVPVPQILVSDTKRALAVLATGFYGNPTATIPLIGITGTNGKTTISYLLDSIFKENDKQTGIIGTIQMKIGQKTYALENTTPNALVLQHAFSMMHKAGIEQAMMEVSSHALAEGRTYGCQFDIAVFTNLTQDHLDYHTDMDAYLEAKALLFSQLGNAYGEKPKFAIINMDDPAAKTLIQQTGQHIMTYGCSEAAQVRALNWKLTAGGAVFTLATPVGTTTISSNLVGKFNIYNMLAAAAAALASGVSLTIIKRGLESIHGVDGRMEQVAIGQPFSVLVDYAHTPDSLRHVLTTIQEFAKQRILVVVGCGGDRDRTKRSVMAKVAVDYADTAIFTSDNPRNENPMAIIQDMTVELDQAVDHYQVIVDRKAAIHKAIQLAASEDIVLIAGKGHEDYQEIKGEKYPFDDRVIAREAIEIKENC